MTDIYKYNYTDNILFITGDAEYSSVKKYRKTCWRQSLYLSIISIYHRNRFDQFGLKLPCGDLYL